MEHSARSATPALSTRPGLMCAPLGNDSHPAESSSSPHSPPATHPASALPLIREVTPQEDPSASIATSAAAANMASIPMASQPDYHLHDKDQQMHMKQVRFDATVQQQPQQHKAYSASTSAAHVGIPTSHCGVSKRGRYVSPGRRAFANRTTVTTADTSTSLAAAARPPTMSLPCKKNNTSMTSYKENASARDPLASTCATRDVPMSPKSTEPRSFIATTPTDFTVDFGSTPSKSGAFDTSNVLAWLASPGLFSPGFSSPNAKGISSKTSTPIVSTSFFFSDVANLPKGGGDNNIICISPLAASKMTPGESWKEVFASPSTRITGRSVMSKPSPKGMDAVLAERDVREDEDLSVLLQLASNSTPQSTSVRKRHDARSPSDPPVLPMSMQNSGKVRLFQKKDERSDSSFKPPSICMRTNSKHGSDQAFSFQPSSDYYGSMRVSIGGGKGPPSPNQHQPYPYQMFAAHYQQQLSVGPNTPYTFPTAAYPDQPPPPHVSLQIPPTAAPRPRKKARVMAADKGDDEFVPTPSPAAKTANTSATPSATKRKRSPNKKKNKSPQITGEGERMKAATAIKELNVAAGGKNDKAAALAAAILRGVTQRPSGKWQAQLYFSGKSRYIGVFDSREKAALAYEIAREKLKAGSATAESTEALVNEARKAAFDGVNEQLDP